MKICQVFTIRVFHSVTLFLYIELQSLEIRSAAVCEYEKFEFSKTSTDFMTDLLNFLQIGVGKKIV